MVNGRIQGKGGNGKSARGTDAEDGGTAFYTRAQCVVDANGGQIWGGGGGGSASAWWYWEGLAGGGGGQGSVPGNGGAGDAMTGSKAGAETGLPGTTEAPGDGGDIVRLPVEYRGGTGGTEGQAGQTGSHPDGTPGAAGNAIDGRSYVLLDGGSPGIEIMGPEIN